MFIILLGPPGAGKGTQSKNLEQYYHLAHISTGDILRSAVKNATEIGKKVKPYMDAGELVPDEIIFQLIEERLFRPVRRAKGEDCKNGALFDGFPRNLSQAERLQSIDIIKKDTKKFAILIEVQDQEVINRLSGRLYCSNCNELYNITNNIARNENGNYICSQCGAELRHRADDDIKTIQNRLRVYHQHIGPLIDYYNRISMLKIIDGLGTPDEVFGRIISQLIVC